jgi:predicted nucleic acid-binding protein
MPRPRGRPIATRAIFPLEDPGLILPERIGLDTSFVVEALIETQPLHEVSAAFFERLVEASATVVTSELLEIELAEAAFAIALKQRWGRRWRAHRTDGRARRPARQLLTEVADRSDLLLSSLDRITIPVGRVTSEAAALMTAYGLASYDAVHAATAISAGAAAIVTLDTGFALLPARQLGIYTDRSRVASCRAKRPRR